MERNYISCLSDVFAYEVSIKAFTTGDTVAIVVMTKFSKENVCISTRVNILDTSIEYPGVSPWMHLHSGESPKHQECFLNKSMP